ncbi:rho GTPase-activating protein 100F-like [Biomphalaria glabrata]|uniref:Rho GTPase-activating protein 100F-like n=1 Tax=Biomphalaria glabrata TaxID=6526 RepID=A0A9W3ACL3_BIOGL|nr:rho GTPase-activating protein 100F-like [Biomphalaria glabrata]
MHWWIRPRVPVQSGMFCCGRSKGEDNKRQTDDSSNAPAVTRSKEEHQQEATSSEKLLEQLERRLSHPDHKTRLLNPKEAEPLVSPDQSAVTEDQPYIAIDAEAEYGTPRRRKSSRPLSDPSEGRNSKSAGPAPEQTIEYPENSDGGSRLQEPPVVVSKSLSSYYDAKKAHPYVRSLSQDESRTKEAVKSAQHEELLKELSLHPRLQSTEQRIQYHHDISCEPRLHLTQQYQQQYQYHPHQQQHQQQHHQQPLLQEKNQYQQPQQQQLNQHSQKRHQHSFSEPIQFQVSEPNRQAYRQISYQQPQDLFSHQQQDFYQNQHIIFQKQQQRFTQSQTTRGHENILSDRGHLQSTRPFEGTLSALEANRKSAEPQNIPTHSSATASATFSSKNSSSYLYANSNASTGSKNGSGPVGLEMGIKSMEFEDDSFVVETVEIIKRPGQTLGFYIREGNGFDRSDGVFISRIQMGTVAQSNGLLHVGDEIVTVNNVKVGNMSLDDVVILMSIPKKLVLTIRTRRNSSKNKSCPSLPMAEKPDPPIVVLKKGRSSSASALEMTEKCPDMYEPGQSYAQYPFQTADYLPRRDVSQDRHAPGSRYTSIFITPQRAEAKLLKDDGVDSSNSSDGSLPRSIDSKERVYLGQEVGDTPHTGYMSVTNPIYDHFPLMSERDYKHHYLPDSLSRKSALPKSPSKQSPLGASPHLHGYRSRTGPDTSPAYSEPPYMNVGALREGLLQQSQQNYQHHITSPHYPAQHQQHFTSHYPFQTQSPHQSYPLHTSPQGTMPYPIQSPQYRGGMSVSQEERRRQERLRTLLNTKSRYGRLLRSRSPECYNSDSELIFTHQQQSDGRGFASDYETYGGAFSDDEPVYSIPRIPSSSSSELEKLLKKFTTLSQELQQEQSKLQRQLSTRDKATRPGQIPLSRADSLSGDEYGFQSISGQGSPVPIRRAASTQTPALPPRLSRLPSADTPPFLYSTYQHESHPDLSGRALSSGGAIGGVGSLSLAGGLPLSTSQTSMQLTKHGETSTPSSPRASSGRLRDLQLTRKPLHIPYSEFEPYKADMRKRVELTRSGGLDGLLSIHIMSGQGLKSSKTSLRDLYCVVAVDSLNKARTMIRTGAINFDWDEAFDVDLEDSKEVSFLIYHWDPNYKHRLCFHGSILLPSYVSSGHKRYVAIKLEPKGILFVTLLYKEPAISLQRLPSIKKNALFGAELESIILRENSGLNVPLIVHKCVQEVERRGLETVGIYRLCGSARRKTMLREAFEADALSVDLSPENVSDIHVITGVLKDYLRELPEPLFTNALYQMLLDALSVRLPCDPEGSAKLMLSILECLPSANQDTMALLLNHLRRVAAHCDKNKMPIDNLAICFGPVLLCPAPSSNPDPLLDFRKHIEVLRYLLEIWDYEGSSSTGTSKSPTADTIISVETGDSPHQTSHQGQQMDSSRNDTIKSDAGDMTSSRQ